MIEIREKLERWKIKAERFYIENKKVFIIDINNTYFFCNIKKITEFEITFIPFKGNNNNEEVVRYWADILKFEEYKEMGY